uniref:NADH-ubiquinone oxidoreductase chain 6 n=1 Tax=Nepa hoffmanni TaxID=796936 RepID=A0A0U2KWK4_9HEMI|nr:NADH dehydrogenase subunit 6 [Nepa hoffmanni]ALG35809.1 NADH dehydrogenase subunit 6 [Nepa hoffmanni]
MKIMIMMYMTLMSMTLPFLKHPLSMGMILMMFTASTAIISGMMIKSFWFSYMLFIILMGGMLVLFMYMASIASNEKMNFSMKIMLMWMTTTMITIPMTQLMDSTLMENMQNKMEIKIMENEQTLSLMKLFSGQSSKITMMMVTYLLLTMIIVTFIVNIYEGPMRKKN